MTTARQVFEATLIELSKVQAPALKLYEFNYLFNKAINIYVNKVYNWYDVNQQTTDDLRVLKSTAYLIPQQITAETVAHDAISYLSTAHSQIQSSHGATYEVYLPLDYLHLLNCICVFYIAKDYKCWDRGSYVEIPAKRLTADSWGAIMDDIYNRPSPTRPYYYLHNRNTNIYLPTNPITSINSNGPDGTDMTGTYQVSSNSYTKYTCDINGTEYIYYLIDSNYYSSSGTFDPSNPGSPLTGTALSQATTNINTASSSNTLTVENILYDNTATTSNQSGSNFPRTIKLDLNGDGTPETNISTVEKPIGLRLGNASSVRCEIRYGKDNSLFQLKEVQVDYIKVPQHIRLTQEQIDLTEDTSQIMEFPDYVTQEIINELVHLVMERTSDPRLQTNIAVDQSIARPQQQQQQQPARQ